MFCSTPKTYRVANEIGAGVGDRVTIAGKAVLYMKGELFL